MHMSKVLHVLNFILSRFKGFPGQWISFYKKQNSNKDDDQACINVLDKVQNHAKQFHSKVNEHPLTYVNNQNMKYISILLHTMYVGTR